MSDKKRKDKEGFGRSRAQIGKGQINKGPKVSGPPPTEFIQKLSKEGLDKFIEQALSSKQESDVKVLDLSRHKISELSPRVKFYMRMLRQVEKLNLYANKLRKLPAEIGMASLWHWLAFASAPWPPFTMLTSCTGEMVGLQCLGLNENLLSDLPAEIGKLKNLELLGTVHLRLRPLLLLTRSRSLHYRPPL
jgi:hypothetical protein